MSETMIPQTPAPEGSALRAAKVPVAPPSSGANSPTPAALTRLDSRPRADAKQPGPRRSLRKIGAPQLARIMGTLFGVLDEVPQAQLQAWARQDSRQYVLLLTALAKLVKEGLEQEGFTDERKIVDAEPFDEIARRLGLL